MTHKIKLFLASFMDNELIFDMATVFAGTLLIGGFDLLYHLVSVRILKPEDYGILNSLISFLMLAIMAINPLTMNFSRYFAEQLAKNNLKNIHNTLLKIASHLLILASVIFLFMVFVSSFIAKFINIPAIFIIITGGIISLSLFSKTLLSLLQGIQRFKIYSILLASSSFVKLLSGATLMYFGLRAMGGLAGLLIQPVFVIFISIFLLPFIFPKRRLNLNSDEIDPSLIYKFVLPNFIIVLSFAILTNTDVLLVKHFFSATETGYYSIAQMIGKVVFFLCSCIGIVILPKGTEAFVSNKSTHKLLYKSLSISALACFIVTGLIFIFPDIILRVLAGKYNPASASLMGLYVLVMSFNALLWITINFSLAINSLKFKWIFLLLSLSEVFFIYSCHTTLKVIILITLSFSIASFLVVSTYVNRSIHRMLKT